MSDSKTELEKNKAKIIQALEAKLAIAKGEKPVGGVKKLLDWYDRHAAIEWMQSMPRSAYCQLSARQYKSLEDQAIAYGIPIKSGASVNLPKVLQWFHNFVAEWGAKINQGKLGQNVKTELEETKSRLEIEQLKQKIEILAIDTQKKRGEMIPAEDVRKTLRWVSAELRKIGERLGKRFGAEAQILFNDNLERLEIELSATE